MDIMPLQLVSPLGNDRPALNDQEMSILHQASLQQMAEVLEEDFQHSPFSFKSPEMATLNTTFSRSLIEKSHLGSSRLPTITPKVESVYTYTTKQVPVMERGSKSPKYLSFGNPDSLCDLQQQYMNGVVEQKGEMKFLISNKPKLMNHGISSFQASGSSTMGTRPYSCSHDHMIAERKRREKLNRQFISLSSIIPCLKKTDKTSLLVSTINYLKELEAKVKALEESIINGSVESAVLVKKHTLSLKDEASLISNEISSNDPDLHKIEAKLTGKMVVIKFQCDNGKGLATKALLEIEKLLLTIMDLTIMPFASSFLDVLVMAKVEDGFSLTMKDLVEKLSSVLSQFI